MGLVSKIFGTHSEREIKRIRPIVDKIVSLRPQMVELTDEQLRVISQPLYNGLNKWYKRIDKELINSLNKPSMKYYSHSGVRYQLLLWIYGVYFRKTEPYKYILGDKNIFNKLEEYNNEIIDEL